MRLTHEESEKTFAGFPNYCMQEEFDRFTGYYWLDKAKQSNPKVGYIVYEVVDETGVNELNFVSPKSMATKLYKISGLGAISWLILGFKNILFFFWVKEMLSLR